MSVVEACKAKAEDLKVGWTAENIPNEHKTTKKIRNNNKSQKTANNSPGGRWGLATLAALASLGALTMQKM